MKKHAPYLLYQIARFGALDTRHIKDLCQGRCEKSVLYESLSDLTRAGLAERISHPTEPRSAYRATPEGYQTCFGSSRDYARSVREKPLKHTLRVADALIALSRYDFVSGFATEFEVPMEQWKTFSHSKLPDGVIQITRAGLTYELSVEVELNPKNVERSAEFLKKYQDAFVRGTPCCGVLLLCHTYGIAECYRKCLQAIDETLAKKFLVLEGPTLPPLNPELYGLPRKDPGICAEKGRTVSGDEIQYLPIKSLNFEISGTPQGRDKETLTTHMKFKENLQPIIQSSDILDRGSS